MNNRPQRLVKSVGSQVLGHWSRERRLLRQGFTALAISSGVGMVAGVVLGSMENLLAELPGLLILVPAAIGMRGAIFGALGARLGTGILTGQYVPAVRGGTFTGSQVEASVILTLFSSALAALAARGAAGLLGLETIGVWELMIVSMAGGILASGFILAGVLWLARTAQQRGWEMDAIGSPIITATGDLVTLPALVVGTLLLFGPVLDTVFGAALLASSGFAVFRGLTRSTALARRVIRESLPVLTYAAIVDIIAGTVLETRVEAFLDSPALLVLIPPFIATCGSLGGILSARLGSDLHLGLIHPRAVPERYASLEGSLTVLFALAAFTGVGLASHLVSVAAGFDSPGALRLVGIALMGGSIATVLLFAVAYTAATTTFRLGLDPDNYGIPIVTATMDLLGVLCLVAAIIALGGT